MALYRLEVGDQPAIVRYQVCNQVFESPLTVYTRSVHMWQTYLFEQPFPLLNLFL